jgi:hypothetical protein
LTPTIEASGPHDFAVRKITRSSVAHPRPSHPDPTSVTIAKRPFVWAGMKRDMQVIWVKSEPKYFCRSPGRPPGKSVDGMPSERYLAA